MRRIATHLFASRRLSKMALNAASHNPPGLKTGPASGQPPPVSSDTSSALLGASKSDAIGQHEGGKDDGDKAAGSKVKSAKELEKERKKAEKQKKFDEKQAKSATTPDVSKNKEKKVKPDPSQADQLPEYREPTPPGEKKSM